MYRRPLEHHLPRYFADPRDVLNPLLDQASLHLAAGKPAVAVFDLDSTLFDLTQRQTAILTSFAKTLPHAQALLLKKIAVHPHDWGLDMAFTRAGHDPRSMPEFKALMTFWREKFFSSEFLHHDQAHPGAVQFTQAFHVLGAKVIYLTGRDRPRMLEGTIESLRQHGFPMPAEAELHDHLYLKPEAHHEDVEFKLNFMQNLHRDLPDAWLAFFDNEAANLNRIQTHLPRVNVVGFASTHSGHEEPNPHISFIDRWI